MIALGVTTLVHKFVTDSAGVAVNSRNPVGDRFGNLADTAVMLT
jgi:hypothetical protein